MAQGEEHFRWRGASVSRIEALSDGVFALSFTLLILSLEVPREWGDLVGVFRQLPVFALTFAAMGWIWYLHHQFHRRYGLEDHVTIAWNLALLFLVLVYVYPLKFLASSLCQMFGVTAPAAPLPQGYVADGLPASEVRTLMLVYSGGFAAVFGVLGMLYRHAWAKREELGLDAAERLATRGALREMVMNVGIAGLSLLLAALDLPSLSGMIYVVCGPFYAWHGTRLDREIRAMASAPR